MKKDSKKVDDLLKDLEEIEGFDLYEGMEDEKNTEAMIDEMIAEMDKIEKESNEKETEGFGNMFNLDLSKNCMILIVILLILILCKEDIMKMSFFKKLFK